jgi:hypothetical protein
VQKTEGEMLKVKNFSRQSLKEIQNLLTLMGLGLRTDLTGKITRGENSEASRRAGLSIPKRPWRCVRCFLILDSSKIEFARPSDQWDLSRWVFCERCSRLSQCSFVLRNSAEGRHPYDFGRYGKCGGHRGGMRIAQTRLQSKGRRWNRDDARTSGRT